MSDHESGVAVDDHSSNGVRGLGDVRPTLDDSPRPRPTPAIAGNACRFRPSRDLRAVVEGLCPAGDTGPVIGLSIDQCQIQLERQFNPAMFGQKVTLTFRHSHDGWNSDAKHATIVSADANSRIVTLHLAAPISLEDSDALSAEFSTPDSALMGAPSRSWELQLQLAQLDIAHLTTLSREVGAGVISLLLSSISAFAVILGLVFALLQAFGASPKGLTGHPLLESVGLWTMLLAALPGIIAVPFMFIFLERVAAVHSYDAFVIILQRSVYSGAFPPCYRGWQDAFSNFNRLRKYGPATSKYLDGSGKTHPPVTKSVNGLLPAHSFTTITALVFMAAPFISIGLIGCELWQSAHSPWHYAALAVGMTVAVVAVAGLFLKMLWSVRYGTRSFDYLLLVYSRILYHAPPYPAQERGPLQWRDH